MVSFSVYFTNCSHYPTTVESHYRFQSGDKMLPVVVAEQSLERRGMHLPDRYA